MRCAIVIVLIILTAVNGDTVDCNGKDFLCYDETRFYQCVRLTDGTSKHYGKLLNCPVDLYCSEKMEYECEDLSKIELTNNTTTPLTSTDFDFSTTEKDINEIISTTPIVDKTTKNDIDLCTTEPDDNDIISTTNNVEETTKNDIDLCTTEPDHNDIISTTNNVDETTKNDIDLCTTEPDNNEIISTTNNVETTKNEELPNNTSEEKDESKSSKESGETSFELDESIDEPENSKESNESDSTEITIPPNTTSTLISSFNTQFECKKTGTFADPQTCSKYHICTKLLFGYLHTTIKCVNKNWSYDSRFKICTMTAVCNKQYNCEFLPELPKPMLNDSSKYYVCRKNAKSAYDIDIYQCLNGYFFDVLRLLCVKT